MSSTSSSNLVPTIQNQHQRHQQHHQDDLSTGPASQMRTKDQLALLGLLPAMNPQPKLTPPTAIIAAHSGSPPIGFHPQYSNPGQWNPALVSSFHGAQASPTLFSAVVANQKHPNWGITGMGDCNSPGSSSMGSYPMSPVMHSSPGSPPTGSPVFEASYPHPALVQHQQSQNQQIGKARSMINGRPGSPSRPKSFDQKSVVGVGHKHTVLSSQQEYQDFEESQNGTRPKSESEKEKVWKQKPERYKTELCRAYEDHNWCKYGSRCQFAHGLPELRQVEKHPKYKTQLCNAYHSTGYCKYGSRCHFVHNVEESRVSNPQIASPNSGMSRQNSEDQSEIAKRTKDLKTLVKLDANLVQPKVASVEISVDMPQIPDNCMEANPNSKRDPNAPVTPIGTPIKSDLSPYDITKEHFIGSSFLTKQSLASIWHPENANQYGVNANNNVVFSFLPKNLLEL